MVTQINLSRITPAPGISSTPPVLLLPPELQYNILSRLDPLSLLRASHTCQGWFTISHRLFEILFNSECCGEDYAQHDRKELKTLRERYLFNRRIVKLAKQAWLERREQMWQYRMITSFNPTSSRPPAPAHLHQTSPRGTLFYSDEGSRFQALPLIAREGRSFEVQSKSEPVMVDLPPDLGAIRKAFSFDRHLLLITETGPSAFKLVIKDIKPDVPETTVDLKITGLTSSAQCRNLLALGTSNGDLHLIQIRDSLGVDSKCIETPFFPERPIDWIAISENRTIFAKSDTDIAIIPKNGTVTTISLSGIVAHPVVSGDKLVFLTRDDKLFILDLPDENPRLLSENVRRIIPLPSGRFLLESSKGLVELWSGDKRKASFPLEEQPLSGVATEKEGLIAVSLEDSYVLVLKEEEETLRKVDLLTLPNGRGEVHALAFTTTLELLITAEKGCIFTCWPFSQESANETKEETVMQRIRRLCSCFF